MCDPKSQAMQETMFGGSMIFDRDDQRLAKQAGGEGDVNQRKVAIYDVCPSDVSKNGLAYSSEDVTREVPFFHGVQEVRLQVSTSLKAEDELDIEAIMLVELARDGG
jgi:hypothetical protein